MVLLILLLPFFLWSADFHLYPARLETSSFDRAKTARIDDRKPVHISNIDRFAIVDSSEFSRGSKSKFQAARGMTDAEWREHLGRERYNVMRKKNTEPAYSGAYLDEQRVGTYLCAGCGQPLFRSEDKYSEPGCGWPLFKKTIESKNVLYKEDRSLGFKRYEVLCRQCESHLGHVFNDGPPPKHLRYTINSIALVLVVKNP